MQKLIASLLASLATSAAVAQAPSPLPGRIVDPVAFHVLTGAPDSITHVVASKAFEDLDAFALTRGAKWKDTVSGQLGPLQTVQLTGLFATQLAAQPTRGAVQRSPEPSPAQLRQAVLRTKRDLLASQDLVFLIGWVDPSKANMIDEKTGKELVPVIRPHISDEGPLQAAEISLRGGPEALCTQARAKNEFRVQEDSRVHCALFENMQGFNQPAAFLADDRLQFVSKSLRVGQRSLAAQDSVLVGYVARPLKLRLPEAHLRYLQRLSSESRIENRVFQVSSVVLIDAFTLEVLRAFPVSETVPSDRNPDFLGVPIDRGQHIAEFNKTKFIKNDR